MNNKLSIREYFKSSQTKDILNISGSSPFVGFKKDIENNENTYIFFPYGYNLESENKKLVKDYNCLKNVLTDYFKDENRKNKLEKDKVKDNDQDVKEKKQLYENLIPIGAYEIIIRHYFNNNLNYYFEKEPSYQKKLTGKIDWSRTIKKIKPIISNNTTIYTNFITRTNQPNLNNLITKINKYCVNEALSWVGFKFGLSPLNNNDIIFNKQLFNSVVKEKLNNTNNDDKKQLFKAMLQIINNQDNLGNSNQNYGTYFFNEIFEYMIKKMFGNIEEKNYYPNTYFKNKMNGKIYENKNLRPDCITKFNNIYYVLDAKYRKYCLTENADDLPNSSEINKQITYGKYVKYKNNNSLVFNVFILPFNSSNKDEWCINIGECYGNWSDNNFAYEKIKVILIDMKYLMQNYNNNSIKEKNIKTLCLKIHENFK